MDKAQTLSNTDSDYYFDSQTALRVVDFFERELTHVEGEWAGKPVVLEKWQKKFLMEVFGWKRKSDDLRKYRSIYLEIPRKNGKSFLISGLSLYLLLADNEGGAKIVSAAADREQAKLVYNTSLQMVFQNEKLSKMTVPLQRAISVPETNSNFKAISAEAYSKHGLNLHAMLVDELHAQPDRELVDVLKTSMAARRQPMEIYITTAGYDKDTICYEMHTYAKAVAAGKIKDPSFYSLIFAAENDDDWTSPETWKKANPNYGVSVKENYLVRECQIAQDVPAYENTFKRLHLNIWTEQETRFIPMELWRQTDNIPVEMKHLQGEPCFAGLDLSSTTDITAFVMCFPNPEFDKMQVIPKFWIPRAKVDHILKFKSTDGLPYDQWEREGLINVTEGDVIDYDVVRRDINEYSDLYNIKEIAFDPWNAMQLALQLEHDGIEMIKCRQSTANLSYPTKEMLSWISGQKILHGGNPILDRMASMVVGIEDSNANIRPDKKKSKERIDGIVAMIMGLWRILLHQQEPELVYKDRGLIKL